MAVSNDLLTDQRVHRHRHALEEAGYYVRLVCRDDLPTRHSRGWRFYAELNWALFRFLRSKEADVLWANDTDTLLGCWLASRPLLRHVAPHRPRLVMDAHELFPEVPELQGRPLVQWVWRTVERLLMPRCDALLTVCQSIAAHYRQELGVQMTVVRNISDERGAMLNDERGVMLNDERGVMNDEPQHSELITPNSELRTHHSSLTTPHSALHTPHSALKTLLYQGCVNLGRGVDWAIDALEWLEDCRLVVAGGGDLLEQMRGYALGKPWADRVVFTGRLAPEALHALTPQADVGLVMLEDMGLSYHYALPNRIGDLVQAGVPMVVSDLPEMAAVVRRHKVGEVMREPGPRALAEAVRRVLDRQWTDGDFASARRDMDWQREKLALLEVAERVTRK